MIPQFVARVPQTRLRGGWLVLARAGWLSGTLLTLLLYLLDLPVRWEHLRQFFATDRRTLLLLAQAPDVSASYVIGLDITTVLLYTAAAAVIYWHKSDDWLALLMSLTLVVFGAAITPATDLLQPQGVAWRATFAPLQTAARGLALLALSLFPDGRFVPRWTRPLNVGGAVWLVSSFLFPQAAFSWYTWPYSLFVVMVSTWYASGVWAQLHRYRRGTNPIQRQQTKWVVFGLTFSVAARSGILAAPAFLPALQMAMPFTGLWLVVSVHLLWLCLLLVPLTFTLAVLRYRLWDIDLLIRRTLLYSALTLLLALVYFASVVLLQQLFQTLTGQAHTPFGTVISTLLIAALFTPLRHRLQQRIDHRFYRRHYDAAQLLAAFAALVRNETNLDHLKIQLVTVIQETLQPTQVSLWLRPTKAQGHHSHQAE